MNRRDWEVDMAKVKEVEQWLFMCLAQGRLEGSCIKLEHEAQ